MPVDIELFGVLAPHLPRRHKVTGEGTVTIAQVAELLQLNPDEVGLIVLDGRQSEWEDLVPTNCRLCFFPPVSGG